MEVRVGTGRAEESGCGCSWVGGGREHTGSVGDGGATDTHEAKVREKWIVEEFEADRAEDSLVLFEDAVGAETTVGGTVAEGVDDTTHGLGGAAAVARRREVLG